MAKKHKIEKETRRLIEGISDLVKKKGDKYKFKSHNKKIVKKVKKTCCHWIIRNGKELPAVIRHPDPKMQGYWKCKICGAVFPVRPPSDVNGESAYDAATNQMIQLVNQIQFLSVRLGGDSDDTKMFLNLRKDLPRFMRVSRQIIKRINKRDAFEKKREDNGIMSQFSSYNGLNYRN